MQHKFKVMAVGLSLAAASVCHAEITDTCFAAGMNFHANTGIAYYHKTDIAGQEKNYHKRWMFSFGAGYRNNFGNNKGDKQQAWLWSAKLDYNYYGEWQRDNNKYLLFGFSALGGLGRQFNKRASLEAILGLSVVRGPTTKTRPTVGAQFDYAFAGNLSVNIQYLHTPDIMEGINTISTGLAYYW